MFMALLHVLHEGKEVVDSANFSVPNTRSNPHSPPRCRGRDASRDRGLAVASFTSKARTACPSCCYESGNVPSHDISPTLLLVSKCPGESAWSVTYLKKNHGDHYPSQQLPVVPRPRWTSTHPSSWWNDDCRRVEILNSINSCRTILLPTGFSRATSSWISTENMHDTQDFSHLRNKLALMTNLPIFWGPSRHSYPTASPHERFRVIWS